MPQPFDATMKDILALSPEAWPRLLGHSAPKAEVINADIATISGAADYAIRVQGKPDWIHHLDFQAGPDAKKPRRLNVYNSVLEDRHQCSVRSSLILLAEKANLKVYTGQYERFLPGEKVPYRTFRYDVVRLWEFEPETFLTDDITLLPLVALTKVTREEMPEYFGEIVRRIDAKADPTMFNVLRSATDILMKLRFESEFITRLVESLPVEHSAWYQALEARSKTEGELIGQRQLIRYQAEAKFGPPTESTQKTLDAITQEEELKAVALRLLTATSWDELLPATKKKPTKRKTVK